jgi:glycosyltransferase involved in cell wall biosynthesis
MHTLHIDNQNGWRGGEQQAYYLIEGLRARGHRVTIAGRPGAPFLNKTSKIDGVESISLPLRNEFDFISAWRIARYVRNHHIDIIHAHTSHAHTHAVLAQRMARRSRVVVSRRVDFEPRHDWLTKIKYGAPDHIVAISDKIAHVLLDYGVAKERLSVVHSGIDPRRMDAEPISREVLGIEDADLLIGNVAALVGHKDHHTLIDAMPHVLRALPHAKLVIAGEGPLRKAIERQIADLSLSDAVHLLGYRDDVPQLLQCLDVFAMSSSEEGLGTTVLDAMAAGVPVVATAGGGIPEMVHDGETGLLSPVNNPKLLAENLVRMWGESMLRVRCVDSARELVNTEFSVERMVEGNLAVYRELIAH